jgi:hypothetical protein
VPSRAAYSPDVPGGSGSWPTTPGAPPPPPDPEYRDLFARLFAPFEPDEIRQRQQAGRTLDYVTARTVANRLDEVLSPLGWKVEYREVKNGIICKLSICIDGEWYAKEDAGGYASLSDQGDNVKAAFSDALKRAAAMWGVGRHLYGSGVPGWARSAFPAGEGEPHRRDAQPARRAPPAAGGHRPPPRAWSGRDERPPQSGPGLFRWAKEKGEAEGNEWKYVNHINEVAEKFGFSKKMVEWTPSMVAQVWPEITGQGGSQATPAPDDDDDDDDEDDEIPY